jgi:hypothetical protein
MKSHLTNKEKVQKILSEALGYKVDLTPKRMNKIERLQLKITQLRERQIARISKGRTKGSGAGGFNRDIENITHQIKLLEIELSELTTHSGE